MAPLAAYNEEGLQRGFQQRRRGVLIVQESSLLRGLGGGARNHDAAPSCSRSHHRVDGRPVVGVVGLCLGVERGHDQDGEQSPMPPILPSKVRSSRPSTAV